MRALTNRQLTSLRLFGEEISGQIKWQWGDWHRTKAARTPDKIWPILRPLIKRGLIETAPDAKWDDTFLCRTTEAGRKALNESKDEASNV
jgi:hypothetical protein